MPKLIAVTGGKGGTGKSTIAVNLACELAKTKKVTLVDCDVDCPNCHLLVGAELKNRRAVHSFIPKIDRQKCTKCGKCTQVCADHALFMGKNGPQLFDKICSGCEACKLVCPEGAISAGSKALGWTYQTETRGVNLVTGELKPAEPLSMGVVRATKERGLQTGKSSDIIILDTAAGTHCDVVAALYGAEKAYVVTEPTPFGTHDLKAIGAVLDKLKLEHEVILNRSDIADTKVGGVLKIPYDEKMIECYVEGEPIVLKYPDHPISKGLGKLTEEIK